jgi:thiol:disulfide interchange protein
MHLKRDEFAVTYDPSQANADTLIQTISDAGYTARFINGDPKRLEETITEIPTSLEPFATALREAEETQKPIFLDFHASWCVPCRRMEQETFSDQKVTALLDRYVVLKIDTDEHIELSRAFGVAGLPDIRLLSANAKTQEQLQGFQSVELLVPKLETFLSGSNP